MQLSSKFMLLALPLALGACVSMPNGPSVLVMPGTGMAFEQFRQDDAQCRQYAAEQTGLSAEGAADNAAVRSAALGATISRAAHDISSRDFVLLGAVRAPARRRCR